MAPLRRQRRAATLQEAVAQALAVIGDVAGQPSGEHGRLRLILITRRGDEGEKGFVEGLDHDADIAGSWLRKG